MHGIRFTTILMCLGKCSINLWYVNGIRVIKKIIFFLHRKKSYLDLIRVSFIVIGLEFAYAAETAFLAPTLLEIGIEHKV